MKYGTLILQLLISFVLLAQEGETMKTRTLSVGAFYSADYTQGAFDGDYGYNTGLNLLWKFSPKFRLNTGLHFASIGGQQKDMTFLTSIGPSGMFTKTFTLKQKHQFTEIPVQMDYFLMQKRISVFISAGIAPNYFIQETRRFDEYPASGGRIKGETKTVNDDSYNTIGISGMLGCGVEMKVWEKWSVQLQPSFRYYFASNRLIALGVNSGIIYNL